MTPAEAAVVLARAAVYDRRTPGEMESYAWAKQLDNVDLEDAVEAVDEHYGATDRWLMPVHVKDRATRIKRARLGRVRAAALAAQLAQENPPQELTDRQRPLLALMAGTPLQPVPRPGWSERKYGKRPIVEKPPFTAEELAAAQAALDEAAAVRGEATSG